MCGYSISWYPVVNFSSPVACEVTTARRVYSPIFTWAGGVTWKRADNDSSSCVKLMGALAGVAVHPAGKSSVTLAFAAPLVPFVTATLISRLTGFRGITARGGVTLTEKAGTTFNSIRL